MRSGGHEFDSCRNEYLVSLAGFSPSKRERADSILGYEPPQLPAVARTFWARSIGTSGTRALPVPANSGFSANLLGQFGLRPRQVIRRIQIAKHGGIETREHHLLFGDDACDFVRQQRIHLVLP